MTVRRALLIGATLGAIAWSVTPLAPLAWGGAYALWRCA